MTFNYGIGVRSKSVNKHGAGVCRCILVQVTHSHCRFGINLTVCNFSYTPVVGIYHIVSTAPDSGVSINTHIKCERLTCFNLGRSGIDEQSRLLIQSYQRVSLCCCCARVRSSVQALNCFIINIASINQCPLELKCVTYTKFICQYNLNFTERTRGCKRNISFILIARCKDVHLTSIEGFGSCIVRGQYGFKILVAAGINSSGTAVFHIDYSCIRNITDFFNGIVG